MPSLVFFDLVRYVTFFSVHFRLRECLLQTFTTENTGLRLVFSLGIFQVETTSFMFLSQHRPSSNFVFVKYRSVMHKCTVEGPPNGVPKMIASFMGPFVGKLNEEVLFRDSIVTLTCN